jgi:hypothetical protein
MLPHSLVPFTVVENHGEGCRMDSGSKEEGKAVKTLCMNGLGGEVYFFWSGNG